MKPKMFVAATAVAVTVAIRAPAPSALTPPPRQSIVVTSTADSGPGTLREALDRATTGTTIVFDPAVFPPANPATIFVLSALPELARGEVTIDGSNAGVALDGSQLPREGSTHGLMITSSGNTIRGLQVQHFPENGLTIRGGAQNNTIGGDRTVGSGPTGQGNVISDNLIEGVRIQGVGTDHNLVIGNYIGTDPTGTSAIGNGFHGVAIIKGAQYNRVGGATAGERNIISGNVWDGVFIHDSGTMYNTVTGNYVGTDISGTAAIRNGNFGVNMGATAQGNLIGGDAGAEGNLISGNGAGGVNVAGSGVKDNTISGNLIGLDSSGTRPLPNLYGVIIGDGASHNIVHYNVISGNTQGVTVEGSDTGNNTVSGNFIGTDAAGATAIPNEIDGVWIGNGSQYNVVGGTTPERRNVISGNGNNGVVIDGSAYNTISGNYVGTDVTGTEAVGNANIGVVLAWGTQHNLVGGTTPQQRNVISGNSNVGVSIANRDTMSNTISGNYIGTDVTGTVAIGNGALGVHLNDGARHNVVGGATSGEGNLISGNGVNGVNIGHSDTMWNVVAGNYIGTDSSGTAALGNVADGVHIGNGATLNVIGPANIIAHNGESGVKVLGADSLGNIITANSIYSNAGSGIVNSEGGNDELPPPILIHVGTRIIRGTAPPNSNVEVFVDEEDQGRTFQGTTVADGEGSFTFTLAVGALAGPKVTATAVDAEGNTSEFSTAESPRAPVVTRELPGIVGPAQVSAEPRVVGTNLGLALFCVLFFGLTSSVFNTILKDYRDELLGSLGRFVPQAFADLVGRLGTSVRRITRKGRLRLVLVWLLVLLVTSLIESFLDPQVGVVSLERLGLLVTLFISAVTVSALELGSDLLAHRRWAPAISTASKVQWLGIAIALGCVILSRVLDFTPGYLYGMVGAIYVMPRLVGVTESGKRAALVLLAIFAGALILWVTTAFLPVALAELEPLFLTAFVIGLQGVFFALIPLAFTDGGQIWNWRKGVWFAFFSIVFFCFYHFLLNPNASDVQALQQNGVQTLFILVVVFGLASVILWVLFPFRLGRARAARD